MLEAIRLGVAIYKHLSWHPHSNDIMKTIRQSIGTEYQISVIQWATIGKQLGVFTVGKKSGLRTQSLDGSFKK